MKKVTIYEVAKEAHVSLATVSRVINGSNVVKEDTKKRVEEAITKLGYRPNAIAQGLALSRTTTVGLILPSTSVSFFSRVINRNGYITPNSYNKIIDIERQVPIA